MGEHHSGTVHLTGQAQHDPETAKVELTPEQLQTVVNIWLQAGRDVDAYAQSQGWGHHPTIDMLREGPTNTATFYDAAHHGQPDLTLEEAAASLKAQADMDAAEESIVSGGMLSMEEMLADIKEADPALGAMLQGILNKVEAKPES